MRNGAGAPGLGAELAIDSLQQQIACAAHAEIDLGLIIALVNMPLGHVIFIADLARQQARHPQRHIALAGLEGMIPNLVYQRIALAQLALNGGFVMEHHL